MTAEYDKTVLLDLMKQPGNNRCIDCNAPHPQWASVNHGIFVCLNCSGEHRSLGVHISFVRSLTMDKWSEDQLTKMRTGGNAKALAFFKESPEYSDKMTITDKYNTHFASQYREKLRCEIEGKPFVPSAAPPPGESASASLRKPRGGASGAGAGAGSGRASPSSFGNGASRSSTPVSASSALGGQANPYATNVQKTANEAFFATMGAANAGRSEDLPPSQGGKYGGFGSDPFPSASSGSASSGNSAHPSAMLSSRALPSLNELQADPLRALGRGWGLFSSTVAQASKTINESVIQPGISRAADPALQENLYSYVSSAKEVLGEGARRGGAALGDGLRAGSGYARQQGLQVGDLGANYVDRYTGAGNGQAYDGYGAPGAGSGYGGYGAAGQTSLESQESGRADMSYTQAEQQQRMGAHDDFFDSQLGGGGSGLAGLSLNSTSASSDTLQPTPPVSATAGRKSPMGRKGLGVQKATPISKKINDDDDDWGKFD